MDKRIFTEQELQVLEYLANVSGSNNKKIEQELKLPATQVESILSTLDEMGFITGAKSDNAGWLRVKLSMEGKQWLRNNIKLN